MSARGVRAYAVVPAAGVGRRMGGDGPKQYLDLLGMSVLEHTVGRLAQHPRISAVVIAVASDDERYHALAARLPDNCSAVTGGAERCHSVLAGLLSLGGIAHDDDWVLVHDAARPCVRVADIERMFDELRDNAVGGILAVPVRDTLKRCDAHQQIEATVDRTALWHAQTPQMFRLGLLRGALEQALEAGVLVTDEAQAVEHAGAVPCVVAGHADNIKITHPEDLVMAEVILTAQGRE